MKQTFVWIPAALALAALVGCGGPRSNVALQDAHAMYNRAERNADARQYAPLALDDARRHLDRAQADWEEGKDQADIDHEAYLARRKAEIALVQGEGKAADVAVTNADARRQELLAQARAGEAEQARERGDRLQRELEELNARQTDRGTVFTMRNDILFDVGQANLKPGADLTLNRLAAFLQEQRDRNLVVEGFTDSTGSEEFNRRLSERRAEAVRDALVQRGIDPARVSIRGYGESYPVASNDTAAGKQLNRRVEIVMSNEPGRPGDRVVRGYLPPGSPSARP